jgi:hypothetical protein
MMQSSTRQPVKQRPNVRERQRETESLVEMKCYEFHNCEFAVTAAEVEDVASSHPLAPGGAFLTLPMFYLEGIVLFPDDTLPLRVLQPRFKVAVERAMQNQGALNILGVVCSFSILSNVLSVC